MSTRPFLNKNKHLQISFLQKASQKENVGTKQNNIDIDKKGKE